MPHQNSQLFRLSTKYENLEMQDASNFIKSFLEKGHFSNNYLFKIGIYFYNNVLIHLKTFLNLIRMYPKNQIFILT